MTPETTRQLIVAKLAKLKLCNRTKVRMMEDKLIISMWSNN